jgi:uncharacterized protein (UPF0210 family)
VSNILVHLVQLNAEKKNEENVIPLVGFSGLMFAALEDSGLAAAAASGYYDIRNLLTYSAVCGIGLDTGKL